MKTIYETEIGIEKKIIILTTKTVEFLLSKNPDSLSLYMFYIKNAKLQKTNSIFNVESFGMKGMGWGRDRYRSAKKILVEEKFIEDVVRRNDKGIILGHYLQINYIFSEETTKDTLTKINHSVANTTGVEQETNALSNTTINALGNTTKILVAKSNEEIKEKPYSFQSSFNFLSSGGFSSKGKPLNRKDFKIIALYWSKQGWEFKNKEQFDSNFKLCLNHATYLKGYTGEQISQAMDYCKSKYDAWSLLTVGKRIADLVNKK